MTGPIEGSSEVELQDLCAGLSDQQLAELAALAEAMHAEAEGRSRFSDLEAKLAAHGARNPAGLARYIGMKKYGKAGFKALQAAGRKKHHGRSYEEGNLGMDAVERRFTLMTVEYRGDDSAARIGGYAAMFSRVSRNLGGFVEVVERSFFNKSRGDGWPEVMCRYNHDDNMLLGTTGAGTLRLNLDDTGLDYNVNPPNSRADVVELVQRGDVRKSSFAFRVPNGGEEWGLSDQGYPMRHLLTGQLIDVAPVNAPAYLDTSAAMRSLAQAKEADVEEVRSAAEADELRRFFVRTDNRGPAPKPKPGLFGPAAAAALLARKQDPYI